MATQISEPIRKFLDKPNFAVLATHIGATGLQTTPVWFLYERGEILVNTSQGRAKLRNMQKNADVALAIVDRENPYQYVEVRGRVSAFDTQNGARDIDRLSHRYRGQAYDYPDGDAPDKRVTIRITPMRVESMGV